MQDSLDVNESNSWSVPNLQESFSFDEYGITAKSTSCSTTSSTSQNRPTVAVIGCGPGGMFFLHALATRRKKLEEEGNIEALSRLPLVTCFERSSSPGGVWRSNDEDITNTANASCTKMYEGLWINCHKEAMEFADYTFRDHFDRALPVYIPRRDVLEYILARVQTQEDIFQYVKFNTTVDSVVYDKELEEFVITTTDCNGETYKNAFDKCIWAGGCNGGKFMPPNIIDMLTTQKFLGQVIHSSEIGTLDLSVEGKRIIMIGDSYSAEDLTLQCLKLGAEKIFISSRSDSGSASSVGAWPGNRVEMLAHKIPYQVTEDGHGIVCKDVREEEEEDDDIFTTVEDVSIIIFCTGYRPNVSFLAPELKPLWCNDEKITWSTPKGWKMSSNIMTSALGEVEPSTELHYSELIPAGEYKSMLISNPNMMLLYEHEHYPLLEIDVSSWLCLSFICGDNKIPTAEVMEQSNMQQLLQEMQIPWIRCWHLDDNYSEKYNDLPDDHWYHDYSSDEYRKYETEGYRHYARYLARNMRLCDYPLNLGSYTKLNAAGERLSNMTFEGGLARCTLTEDSDDVSWRTFRDCDPTPFSSVITGLKATPLPGKWIDLDDEGKSTSKKYLNQ